MTFILHLELGFSNASMRLENTFVAADGVGEKTERRLWRDGVGTWREFEERDVLGSRTRDNVLEFVDEARDRLDAGDAGFFADRLPSGYGWRMYPDFSDTACFFDIETTGLSPESSVVTTVSFHRGGDTRTLVRGDDLTADAVQRELDRSSLVVSYNGKCFDQPFLENELGVEFDVPHLDSMYLCRRLDYTGGLKQVEHDLGVSRGLEDVDGREAVRLWRRYEGGDDEALDRLVRYNRFDTVNLSDVVDRALQELHERETVDI